METKRLSRQLEQLVELAKTQEEELAQYRSRGATPPVPIEQAGKVIREARLRQGLKQVDLQDLAGVGITSVVNVENGQLSVQLDTLKRLAGALGLRLYIGD